MTPASRSDQTHGFCVLAGDVAIPFAVAFVFRKRTLVDQPAQGSGSFAPPRELAEVGLLQEVPPSLVRGEGLFAAASTSSSSLTLKSHRTLPTWCLCLTSSFLRIRRRAMPHPGCHEADSPVDYHSAVPKAKRLTRKPSLVTRNDAEPHPIRAYR